MRAIGDMSHLIRNVAELGQEQMRVSIEAGDRHGKSNVALRKLHRHVTEAISDLRDLLEREKISDEIHLYIDRAVDTLLLGKVAAEEVLTPQDEEARAERLAERAEAERQYGWPRGDER